ncbi:hypothetical protein [Clostridium sp.]|uniref:hypothetical protein n=1 Tax=Clostridium sp. TaxID=1506 RepID=UPI001A5D89AA|nr:hypothetical protein [Clostridium sp.]MBK5243180.1 hypothetical protein [Clostridium sp.]
MDIEKKMFEIFQTQTDKYNLYISLIQYCKELENNTKGIENSKFYSNLTELQNSINNVGWERRHSEQISYLNKLQNKISDKYDDYLY